MKLTAVSKTVVASPCRCPIKRTRVAGGRYAVKPGERQTTMPWSLFGGMTEADLGAIFDHLRTLPAIKNRVETFEAP